MDERRPNAPTIADVIRTESAKLAAAGFDTPRLDVEVLLRFLLGIDRSALFMRLREPLDPATAATLSDLVDRRLTGTSVAYLTGTREFMGHSFTVGPGVLVPRPETEWLVEWAARQLHDRNSATVVDVGTGSGAMIASLALQVAPSHVLIGSDISASALAFARRNARLLGVEDRVAFVLGDLLSWATSPIDLVIANLPYLRPEQVKGNRELAAEPVTALVSGADGLHAIRRIIHDLPRVLAPGGSVGLELDPSQASTVATLLREILPSSPVTIVPDLSGLNRMVVSRRN